MMSINRRMFLGGTPIVLAGLATGCVSSSPTPQASSTTSAADRRLTFDPSAYTEKTTTISTHAGDKSVIYRFYGPLTYVANPVNADYQSLTISVPVTIDGQAVDASNAPILFANAVGGYMPATVKDATGVGEAAMEMGPVPGGRNLSTDAPPSDGEVASGGNAMLDDLGKMVNLAQLAVASGYVAVEPGCRGRSLVDGDGVYYGTAPAAIVDLKAAIRYLRANSDQIPGDTDRIVSTGTSAGGALSALLGASADHPMYQQYLDELGAADASDAIFASGAWCPIADLGHADGAYEWNWGTNPTANGQVDQALSQQLRNLFADYQASLKLDGLHGFGPLTADNYPKYLLETYLWPSATRYLLALSEADRAAYLEQNAAIRWESGAARFTWQDYLIHVGNRKKTLPAFDAFDLSAGENNLFGTGRTEARHFTEFSATRSTWAGNQIEADIPALRDMMNPMHFATQPNPQRSKHWWIRLGTNDSDTSLTVSSNLAASLAGLGDEVNHLLYWDEGHGANTDAADFITWIETITN
jgi:acetyl esterase/lipase